MKFNLDYLPIGWSSYLPNHTYTITLTELLNSVVKSIRWNVNRTDLQVRSNAFYQYFIDYFPLDFNLSSGFISPDIDPTEKGHFSNVVGRAFADYLAKRLLNVIYSENYEHVSGITGNSPRPDLVSTCYDGSKIAIEAKGYTSKTGKSNQLVRDAKIQARKGTIPVTHKVASVTSDIYQSINVIFKDPPGDGEKLNRDELVDSTVKYFKRMLGSLRRDSELIRNLAEIDILLKGQTFDEMFGNGKLDFLDYYTYVPTHLRQNQFVHAKIPFIIIFDKRIEGIAQYERIDNLDDFLNNPQQETVEEKTKILKKMIDQNQPIDLLELFGINEKVNHFNKVNKNQAFIDTDGIGIVLL